MPEPSGTGATSGPRRGAGPTPERRRSIATLVADTRIPSFPSSPLILMYPHRGFSLAI
jgi:hypothetical protein